MKANDRASAKRHQRVRLQHSDELAQDYVEAIHELRGAGLGPRVTDLQAVFGVSHVTVIRALDRLEARGLVERRASEGIVLSREGEALAIASARRHALVVAFLVKIGVSEAQAEVDAEGLEHHLSDESLAALKRFLGRAG